MLSVSYQKLFFIRAFIIYVYIVVQFVLTKLYVHGDLISISILWSHGILTEEATWAKTNSLMNNKSILGQCWWLPTWSRQAGSVLCRHVVAAWTGWVEGSVHAAGGNCSDGAGLFRMQTLKVEEHCNSVLRATGSKRVFLFWYLLYSSYCELDFLLRYPLSENRIQNFPTEESFFKCMVSVVMF